MDTVIVSESETVFVIKELYFDDVCFTFYRDLFLKL